MRTRGTLVPYANPTSPNEKDLGLVYMPLPGKPGEHLAYERFDQQSWTQLPPRIRVTRGHRHDDPLGWCTVRNTPQGLVGIVDWADSQAGRDAATEIRSGLMSNFSITFEMNATASRVSAHHTLPMLLHRDARLKEVGLVARPAYRNAKVTDPDFDQAQANAAELEEIRSIPGVKEAAVDRRLADIKLLTPGIQRIKAKKERVAADRQLIDDSLALAAHTRDLIARAQVPSPPTGTKVLTHYGRDYRVLDLEAYDRHWLAHRLETARALPLPDGREFLRRQDIVPL